MKFGVGIVPHDLNETAVSARLAEDHGFDSIGIPDSQSLWRELYLSLSVVANATSKVRIGPMVTNAITRHPAVAASAIAKSMSARRVWRGTRPSIAFSFRAISAPPSLPEQMILTPWAPACIVRPTACLMALRYAMRRTS